MRDKKAIAIGELARRTGVAVSAIRFYEERGLLASVRDGGGRRWFVRADIRRVSFVIAAQRLGFTLKEIEGHLAGLPRRRTPTAKDWARIAEEFRTLIDERIARMTDLRDRLTGCIGCGCLSLETCALYNPADEAGALGAGPRFLMGDRPAPRQNKRGTNKRRKP